MPTPPDFSRPSPPPAPPALAVPGDALSRALFEQTPLSTVVYDANGYTLAANSAFERLFGLRLADLPREYRVTTDPQLEAQGLLPLVRAAFEGERVTLPPVRYVAAADLGVTTETWTQGHFFPLRDDGGRVSAVVLVHVDLTARINAEAALRDGQARLREALVEAHRAQDATRILAEAGTLLASSLDYERTLASVARLAVPALADICIIDLVDADGGLRRVATAHADPTLEARLAELRRFSPTPDSDGVVARTLRTGEPQLLSRIGDVTVEAAAASRPEHVSLVRELAPDAALCVPLVAREVTIGTMLLVTAGSGRYYAAEDVPLAMEVARRAALAVDNARLHAEAVAAREASEAQARELELGAQQLQEQATELEAQQVELEHQIDEGAVLTEELRATNDALERTTRDVEAILESISDPFVVYDASWRFRYVNGAAAAVFNDSGRAEGVNAMLGVTLWEAYPDIVGSGFERAMRRAAEERSSVTFEEYRPQRGAWSEVRCYPMPDGGLSVTWRDITARKRAEEAEHYVAEATALLASSLEYEATLAALARLVVPRLADWCSVDLVGADGAIERVTTAHVDPAKMRWAEEIQRRYPIDPDAPTGVPNVIRTGEPELVADIDDALIDAVVPDPEQRALIRAVGLRSAITVPLTARGRTLGALSLVSAESGRRYDEADLRLAGELARRAALAVDNARLHEAALAAERVAAGHAASAERFRHAQESSPDAFALFDAVRDEAGRVVDFAWAWANAAALRVQQTELEALRGQRMLDRNPGLAATPLFAGYLRAMREGVPYEDEVHYRHEWIDTWFRISAVPVEGGLAVSFADVSDRKRAERRTADLYALTQALALATTRAEVGAVVLDHAFPVFGVAAGSLLELDAERGELVLVAERGLGAGAMRAWDRYPLAAGTPGADAVSSGEIVTIASHEEWRARYPQHLAWVAAAGVEGSAVVPLRAGDRTLGVVALQVRGPRTFDADERQFLLGFADQCAQALERVRLFEAEQRAREELARVFAEAPAAIALTRGPEHVFQIANPRYEALVGRAGIVGRPLREALPELAGQGYPALFDELLRTGEPFVGTETPVRLARGPNGEEEDGWFTFVFQPVALSGDAVDGIAIVATDVTAQVRARLESDRLREAAEEANLAKSKFLAAMSHELRTPLNAIGGYADLLLLGVRGPVTPAQTLDLERINRSQRHLLGVINDILNFARVEAGAVSFEMRALEVRDLLREVEPLVLPQVATKELTFDSAPGTDGLALLGDRERVRQILLNLLANAIKFTPPGGRVWTTADGDGDVVRLRVHDTGIGVPADRMSAIFEPFVQVHRSLSTPVEGTGLGLTISRDLARGMGGDLTAESAVGLGSTFTLTLPRAPRQAPARAARPAPNGA